MKLVSNEKIALRIGHRCLPMAGFKTGVVSGSRSKIQHGKTISFANKIFRFRSWFVLLGFRECGSLKGWTEPPNSAKKNRDEFYIIKRFCME